ncbi:hypothetical protein TCAL_14240 [Tigriopus californicus]|uniref:RRM domain-containing protein n=1 Tax=Tigriopus californicus TaxID=6832 RepID=A0A553NV65_TIGCA|nr:hypothetical protein TCAL_14240 [Tigriopus californicus]
MNPLTNIKNDQRSTILTVDNLNGIKLCGRTIRVDHVQTYKLPKDLEKLDADKKKLFLEGCAPQPLPQSEASSSEEEDEPEEKRRTKKKSQKEKKSRKKNKKKKKKKKKLRDSSSESSSSDSDGSETLPKRPERDSGRDALSRSPRQNKLRSGDDKRRRSRDRNDDRRRRSRSRDRSRDRVREPSRNQERRRCDPDSSSSKRRNDYRR